MPVASYNDGGKKVGSNTELESELPELTFLNK